MSLITKYLVLQDGLSDWVGKSISWLIPLMIGILLWEIANRYIIGVPTEWVHQLSAMIYGTVCFGAGAYTLRHKGHVRSEVIYQMFSKRGRAFLDLITHSLGLFVMCIFFKLAWEFAAESWAMEEISNKGTWQPIIYPFKTVMPIAVGLVILQSLAELIRDFCTAFNIEIDDPRAQEHEPLT
ncbi:TRAP transporter small permease subunit [Motiliproteus sp.]|uniref:TRAP transporter small permease subunit n=1 Tax=Motiliproteus sp. TaxID=1898955 RepID=UPI003BACF94F